MLKRLVDIVLSAAALLVLSPVLVGFMVAIWLQDFHSPFYIASRVGRRGRPFRMVKLRSMLVGADRTGVDSTAADDKRITAVGRLVRAYKIDELSQLWNVLKGDMSLVGPRPNVQREIDLLTDVERRVLNAKPGITDIASIVFSDEGDILKGQSDPDLAYHQLIRPWKSRLALLYVEQRSFVLDVVLVWLTAVAIVSRPCALAGIQRVLARLGAGDAVRAVARRDQPLRPSPPPGTDAVVSART